MFQYENPSIGFSIFSSSVFCIYPYLWWYHDTMETKTETVAKPSVQDADLEDAGKEDFESNRLAPAQMMSPEEFAAVEKRLKRKLDIRLLVCVWVIFVMNYLDRVRLYSVKHLPSPNIPPEQYIGSKGCRHRGLSAYGQHTVRHGRGSPVRRICTYAIALEHLPCASATVGLHSLCDGHLGSSLCPCWSDSQCRGSLCSPFLPRICGSCILP